MGKLVRNSQRFMELDGSLLFHKNQPLDLIVSQSNPLHTTTTNSLRAII
jgi:hypothetical protein